MCADEVSVDAKGLFVREALCYAYLGKLLYSYGVKYRLLVVFLEGFVWERSFV